MNKVNQFAISSILNSEIVGRFNFGHGQIDSLADGQRFLDTRSIVQSPAEIHGDETVDKEKVKKAFLEVRDARGDKGSPDLYIADPERNALFLAKCRQLGLKVSEYILNKTLLNARKSRLLTGLKSERTSIKYFEDIEFACEFAASELRYKLGVSIDDIICDPAVALQFDAIAAKLSPGHTSLEYRWAILSIRKKNSIWKPSYNMPKFEHTFRLVGDAVEKLPIDGGAYILYEDAHKRRALYARSTQHLRDAIDLHRDSRFMDAILDKFWEPNVDDFVISFAEIPEKKMLDPVERKIIENEKPLFNVPRAA